MKKVLVVLGSPRKNGNSATLAQNAIAAAEAEGAEVEKFYLHELDIKPCNACEVCREGDELDCNIDDDMKILYPKLRQADSIVIASPIYWFTFSAQTKLLMDRCYALEGPHGNALQGKKIGIILTYGDSDPFSSGAVNAIRTFQDAFTRIAAHLVGIIYGSASAAGEIKANRGLMEKAYNMGKQIAT